MTTRADADRCPGVLRPHQAEDGALLRIRIPGGRVDATALLQLSEGARQYADGDVHLTSRANLQLRGVRTNDDGTVVDGLVDALAEAGLLPHPTHDRVRNIMCSPLTGLAGGRTDLRPTLSALDAAICAAPDLAALPGPFLFALDDGRGDIGVVRADLAAVAVGDDRVRLWAGGVEGPELPLAAAVPALFGFARRFVDLGSPAWHVRELPGGGRQLLARADRSDLPAPDLPAPDLPVPEVPVPEVPVPADPTLLGMLGQYDGRMVASVLVPLGRLTGPQVQALAAAAAAGRGRLIVTPGRGMLVPDLLSSSAMAGLTGSGLITGDDSGWRGVTACPGLRCARGAGDTEGAARQIAARPAAAGQLPVHVVACSRCCGAPAGPHVLATVSRSSVEIRCGGATIDVPVGAVAGAVAGLRGGPR
ncbi:cobalamin biosynthesis protein CobG [Nakamurella sp.]|uniref:cobalamin biosynthesis protein CobG n=1 Tax=Nakamurella sp. TaxID=1869182 RepID=UPI0037834E7B